MNRERIREERRFKRSKVDPWTGITSTDTDREIDGEEEEEIDEDDNHDNFYDGDEDEELQEICCLNYRKHFEPRMLGQNSPNIHSLSRFVKCCRILRQKDEMRKDRREDHP